MGEKIGNAEYRAAAHSADGAEEHSVDLPSTWGPDMSEAAKEMERTARVTLGDRNLDAKLFPQWHPYGTGSLEAEEDNVSMSEYLRNRLLLLQNDFRRSPVWAFQSLDRIIKNDLYFRHHYSFSGQKGKRKENAAMASAATTASDDAESRKRKSSAAGLSSSDPDEGSGRQDNYEMLFGRTDPRHIPASAAWWKARQ